ncbi:putative zinc-binding peptidase [Xylophilus sp. GOD-11R]|uniref:zinc-binding metallopeptidase family protein n=1 Tax=Xylophilus sp. GOD-11R TaxID=3089814 RepID=UPI00298CC556|nr:putative zinc-binding peptidase [Xylophilus sp. GOD-11R]WPB56586.1 putative zinc-binding peptidase [Xylophilus sp. GOD-11R]
MKIFNCDNCGHPVFFENVQCLNCGCALAFLPDQLSMAALLAPAGPAADGSPGLWVRSHPPEGVPLQYRMCLNHDLHQSCNFAVPPEDPNHLCVSCRQTRVFPDLSIPENSQRWYRIEVAKRRLFYTLARLGLASTTPPAAGSMQDGPVYEFLADVPGGPRVMTGHNQGLITLNIAEADDDERERRRVQLGEPYRTLLGHLRHESGHFYWDRLIREGNRIDDFRAVFGDESLDYQQALQAHYAADHSANEWQVDFVSAYATSHPWEDWAETWAHYLHMVDLLETAAAYGTQVEVPGMSGGTGSGPDTVTNPFSSAVTDFDQLVQQWVPVTLMLNSLNRSLGQDDAYPFALSQGALHKLRFVHDVIHQAVDIPLIDDKADMTKPADSQPADTTAPAAVPAA